MFIGFVRHFSTNGFTPSGSPLGYWSADTITGLEDGDPVGTWPDQSGNGNDATQATAANKPTYKAALVDFNNQPGVEFDYTDDYMVLTGMTAASGNYTFFWVCDPTHGVSTRHCLFDWETSRTAIETGKGATDLEYWDGGGYRGTTDGIDGAQILTCRLEATDKGCFYRNGALVEGNLTYAQREMSDIVTLGSHINASNRFDGPMTEVIAYNSALSDADRSANETGLNTKYEVF
jgi:hypothetical protein